MKKIAVLGSTGSIGTQTLDIAEKYPDRLQVMGLSAGTNVSLMEKQIRKFHPILAVMGSEEAAADLRDRVKDTDTRIAAGMDGLLELASMPEADTVVTAIVGMIGIRPTMEAIRHKKEIALANKETLVTAGHLIMPMAKEYGVNIYPVDSEHSAIFQCLQGQNREEMRQILLTASGGPFRGKSKEDLCRVTLQDALKHPNWSMGRKITIDSATMVNKALEVMEACHLFGVGPERITVMVHPQSIVHSAVEFNDGAVIAQMGIPDMKLPIQYALFYPERLPVGEGSPTETSERLDLFKLASLTFEKPDPEVFEGLALGFKACKAGGSMPTVFNAANEAAVALFLEEKIRFCEIPERIGEAMESHTYIASPSLEQILETEREARERIEKH